MSSDSCFKVQIWFGSDTDNVSPDHLESLLLLKALLEGSRFEGYPVNAFGA